MAEKSIKERQYAYANNSNQVLQEERDRSANLNVPSGAAESLAKRKLPKMGDRARVISEEAKKELERKEQQKRQKALSMTEYDKKRKSGAITIDTKLNNIIATADEYNSKLYHPKTDVTKAKYARLLDKVFKYYPDESGDIIADVANEVLSILKSNSREKMEQVKALLNGINETEFADLMDLSKELTDFGVTEDDNVNDEVVALDMDVESDEEHLDELMSEEDEYEGDDVAQTEAITTKGKKMEEEDEFALKVEDIDPFWLNRRIKEFEPDADKAAAIADQVLAILLDDDEREDENKLVELIGSEHVEFISQLLTNRVMLGYVIRYRQAQNEAEKQLVLNEMQLDGSIDGTDLVQRLTGNKARRAAGGHDDVFAGRRSKRTKQLQEDEESLKEEERQAISEEMNMPKPNVELNLTNLEFTAGSHLMSRKALKLPDGTYKVPKPGYEEVHVPPAKNKYSDDAFMGSQHLVSVKEMPEWFHKGFAGVEKLNLVQSKVYNCAMLSSENMLLCAPTGAGKTNVALMAILHEMWMHRREDGSVDLDKFKIVYVAPMKALVREMVESFGSKLEPYGMKVRELSGDMSLTKEEISDTQLIITTPEKWDIITRKSGDRTYTQLVRLIIIDEIHLLHDERGPVLESLVARTVRQVETTQEMVRLVGLSATLPNYEDVATFLRVDPEKGLFHFDSSYRPVALEQQFIGIKEKSSFKSMQCMNEVCYEKVMEKAGKKQVLIFVHSRKETANTANFLLNKAIEKDESARFFSSESARLRLEQEVSKYSIKSEDLKKLLPAGFAIHHAGLCRKDRTAVETLFGQGLIQVLVSTMTLAWGVNLPAHTVIIKGTQMYSPEKSAWVELSPQDILQMLGRAGRPQFEKCGVGIIITKATELNYYISLMNEQLPIESQFIKKLAENLNAEIVMGTVQNLSEAVSWLSYTYLYIRMLKNPILYGYDPKLLVEDPTLLQYRVNLIHSAACVLAKNGLVKYDKKAGLFESTELGRIASYYYLSSASVATYNENMKPSMTEIDLFRLFSMSSEFSQIVVRPEEKLELDMLMKKVPIPIRETVDNPCAKVSVLLQAYISRVKLEKFAMTCDMVYVTQSAGRILRALFEIAVARGWSSLAQRCLNLCKMVTHEQWNTQSPLRQFGTLPATVLQRLDHKPISFDRYYDMEPSDLAELVAGRDVNDPRIGDTLYKLVHKIPRLEAEAAVQPLTRLLLSVDLTLTAAFNYDVNIHKNAQGFHIFVEDCDGAKILYYQYFILKAKYADEPQYLSFTVPLLDPLPPQYFLRICSDTWLRSETTHTISFRAMTLPKKPSPYTQLIDLQPLSLSALNNPQYEEMLAPTLSTFNTIQTQVFATVYESDQNVLLAARSGSGKGVVGELAMFRQFSKGEGKVLYLCPVPEVCERKMKRWSTMFAALGKQVGMFIGNDKEDTLTLSASDIVIATPEQMDAYTCRGLHMKLIQQIKLVLIDKLHMIGSNKGYLMEVVISRLKSMESQSKNDPSHTYSIAFRYVVLSNCISNASALANWLNVRKGLFSFHSSVKVNPVQIRVQGFDINHAGTRLLAMSKPMYTTVAALSAEKAALVFVPSRKQAHLSAIDILTFVSASSRPKRFNHIPEDKLEEVLNRVVDPVLKTVLQAGVAFYTKGMDESDAQLVLQLFTNDWIQVLVSTYDLCWSLDFSVHLVLVMDTCFYDGKEHSYIEYPIYDILQMVGLASRAGKFAAGKAIVFTHVSKKEYLSRFLSDPLPIESSFNLHMNNPLCAAVASNTVSSIQNAMDWLTWFFFYHRLPENPTYYGLSGVSEVQISEYLSALTEDTAQELVNSGSVELDEEGNLGTTNYGQIAAHLYVDVRSIEIFAKSVTAKTKRKGLLEILVSAVEFEDLPVRQQENKVIATMERKLTYVVQGKTLVARKVNALLQNYFSREAISTDMHEDTMRILPLTVRLLHSMVNVCTTKMWLKPAMAAIELCQMVIQGMWNEDSRLTQFPHFDKDRVRSFEMEGVDDVFAFLDMDEEKRTQLLEGLSESEINDVSTFCSNYPDYAVDIALDASVLQCAENHVVTVTLSPSDGEEGFHTEVESTMFPQKIRQTWWLILGDPADNTIHSIVEVDLDRTNKKKLQFTAPNAPGHYKWMLYFMPDSYVGCDQEMEIEFDVEGEPVEMEEE